MSFLLSTRNNSSQANVSRLTDSYHQTILCLAETSNTDTEIPWQVTQHVLDRVWSTSSNIDASSFATITDVDDTVVYACQGCGYFLHPGWKGTNLRVKRSNNGSSSNRRRQQRKRRRVARAEEMKANDNKNNRRRSSVTNTNNNTNSGDSDSTAANIQHRLVLLLNDESCTADRSVVRNHLVLTCGRCRDKIHLKGLLQQQLKTTSSNVVAPTYKKKMISSITSLIGGSNSDGTGNLADNFEPLPPGRSSYQVNNRRKKPSPQVAMAASIAATVATSSTTKSSSSLPSISLLEQKRDEQFGARKRKKKAKSISSDKKTGNLLDFLSALNDH
jgi:hypothetical protein